MRDAIISITSNLFAVLIPLAESSIQLVISRVTQHRLHSQRKSTVQRLWRSTACDRSWRKRDGLSLRRPAKQTRVRVLPGRAKSQRCRSSGGQQRRQR